MRNAGWLALVPVMVALPLMVGSGCPGAETVPTVADLTTQEKVAGDAMLAATAAISEATGVTQAPTDTDDNAAASIPEGVSFGTCPVVTTALGTGSVALTIDFGAQPCTPEFFPELACSGSATGTYTAGASSIAVTFNSIGCNSKSLSGDAEVTFNLSQSGVVLTGTFDLGWLDGSESVDTAGAGEFHYDRTAKATTISSFSGTVTNGDGTYTAVCTDVVVSYQNNANLIPSGGTIELSRPNIRSLTLRFNADSPTTGDFEMSIAGGPFFTVNLSEL